MPLSDERLMQIADEVLAEQRAKQRFVQLSYCSCCGKPLNRTYEVPTECEQCETSSATT